MDERLEELRENHLHLDDYLKTLPENKADSLSFYDNITRDMKGGDGKEWNLIYELGEKSFTHIDLMGRNNFYTVINPSLGNGQSRKVVENIKERILTSAPSEVVNGGEKDDKTENKIDQLFERVTTTGNSIFNSNKITINEGEKEGLKHVLKKDVLGYGKLDPILQDRFVEDIHCISLSNISVLHEIFGLLTTNIRFETEKELEGYIRNMSNLLGKNVTESNPITDGSLPDGSRVNIVYSKDVSKEGASFTIRRFTEEPISIIQIVDWGTVSAKMAAYMWLALESQMSAVVSGVTASGKTTTMNSFLPFIGFNKKIYSAEDTPEVRAPQETWQRLVTREEGPEDTRVELFDLVKTALRSRPDYIIVGEVRGREGSAAFQAIQTGHPVMTTFHADSISKLIQRFTGDPINVPIRFMDNLNIAMFQHLIQFDGKQVRRCTSIEEILSYSERDGGVKTRQVFSWDPVKDEHRFLGMHNSYILEELVAKQMGLTNKREIYDVLEERTRLIKKMVKNGIVEHDEVVEVFKTYSNNSDVRGLQQMELKIEELISRGDD